LDFHYLLSTSKKLFRDISYETRIIRLTGAENLDAFLSNNIDQRRILSKMKNPVNQLHFHCSNRQMLQVLQFSAKEISKCNSNPTFRQPVTRISNYQPNEVTAEALRNAKKDYSGQYYDDFYSLFSILPATNLDFSYFSEATFLKYEFKQKNLQLLVMEKGKMSSLTVIVQYFTHIQNIQLVNCLLLTDVSALGNIPHLSIVKCPQLEDISKLTSNYSLVIKQCPKIRETETLYTCRKLTTDLLHSWDSETYRRISRQRMFSLQLITCRIKDLSSLSFLHTIHLENCDYFTTIPAELVSVSVIILIKCASLSDISGLGKNYSVYVKKCNEIKSFAALKNIPKVKFAFCSSFTNGLDVENVQYLQLEHCENLRDISMLSNVHSINITDCFRITTLRNLGSVRVIQLNNCSKLVSLQELGGEGNLKMMLKNQQWTDNLTQRLQSQYHVTLDSKTGITTFLRKNKRKI
jgi:hypothetical protein